MSAGSLHIHKRQRVALKKNHAGVFTMFTRCNFERFPRLLGSQWFSFTVVHTQMHAQIWMKINKKPGNLLLCDHLCQQRTTCCWSTAPPEPTSCHSFCWRSHMIPDSSPWWLQKEDRNQVSINCTRLHMQYMFTGTFTAGSLRNFPRGHHRAASNGYFHYLFIRTLFSWLDSRVKMSWAAKILLETIQTILSRLDGRTLLNALIFL